MTDCIFCKTISGEVPCTKIYEDDDVLAFLDIAPITPGHTLVLPKKHFELVEDAPEETLAKCMSIIKKVIVALDQFNGGTNIGLNNKGVAGQWVPHIHFHVIPRNDGDGLKHWINGKYKEGESEAIAEKIKSLLK